MTWDDMPTWDAWPDWNGPAQPESLAGRLVSEVITTPF